MSKEVKKTFAEKAYKTTKLDSKYTEGKIEDMLAELGITDIRVTKIGSDYTFEFLVKLRHDESARKVRIQLPFNTELGEKQKSRERRENALFRVLYYHLKDKFVAVQNGLKEFEEEFLADLVVVSGGKEMRLGEILVPKYKAQLKNKKVAVLTVTNDEN